MRDLLGSGEAATVPALGPKTSTAMSSRGRCSAGVEHRVLDPLRRPRRRAGPAQDEQQQGEVAVAEELAPARRAPP